VNPALYFALSGAGVLVLLAIWRTRAMNRRFLAGDYFAGEEHSAPSEPDYSCLELGSKIFDSSDSVFVARETSPRFARRFREERTGLALEWLSQIRRHTNRFMHLHARAARANPDLRAKDEIALGFDFLIFHLTMGMLYCAVWLRGPFHVAKLVGYSVAVGRHFEELARDVLPSARFSSENVAVAAEDPRGNRSTVAR